MTTSEKIKKIRCQLDLTQKDLAALLSMSQSGFCNCELGFRKLSLSRCYKLIKIAKLKGIELSIEYLRPDE